MFVLVKAAGLFVDNSEKFGIAIGIPKFIIGITVLAVGTSLPELVSSLFSIHIGQTEYMIANVIGANISNLLLNIGLTYLIAKQMTVTWDLFNGDAVLLVASTAFLTISLMDGTFTRIEAIVCLLGYLVYLQHALLSKKEKQADEDELIPKIDGRIKPKLDFKIIAFMVLGAVGVFFGARFTLQAVINLSSLFGFDSTSVLAMTLVSIGTTLPEMTVSLSAIKKGNFDMVLGNVIGSNIFNVFVIMGVGGVIAGNIAVDPIITAISIPALIVATVLFLTSMINKKSNRSEGHMFLIFYLLFLLKTFGLI